ncbi:hypothetical protein [Brevundimonas sp. SORGH_AS_0993]|uniref:hypothetical protein n=1 Tax=Brevundimonas sp. SORGH_AS_0993 TaxID=3041794 RepID=UPI00277E858F|nr:hypothetical protein [Brevundimonas sp. SORGH_AS_0993]MDQ1154486.1 hypothetical protein [Brevundimonas sp. SORGH_AS_0993]
MPNIDLGHLPLGHLGAGRTEQLERIAQAGLVRQGRVFLLSFDAIRKELGDRWPNREEIVWQTFERDLARALPPPDQFLRLNETTIIAAIASADAYAGQVKCAEVFRQVLAFFLGRNQDSDLSMARVSSLTAQAVVAEQIDPAAPPPPPPPPAATNERAAAAWPTNWIPPLESRRTRTTFVTERDGPADIDLWVSPVWRLDLGLVGAYAVRRGLPRGLETFTDRDLSAIDLGVADFLEPIMQDYRRNGAAFAIFCPFTFTTMSARGSRLRLLDRCAPFIEVMGKAVVLEIDGLRLGAPDSRISDTLSMCRPFGRVRMVSIHDPQSSEILWADHGAGGVALDADGFTQRQAEAAAARVRKRRSNILVHAVPPTWSRDSLAANGVTHITEARQTAE